MIILSWDNYRKKHVGRRVNVQLYMYTHEFKKIREMDISEDDRKPREIVDEFLRNLESRSELPEFGILVFHSYRGLTPGWKNLDIYVK